MFPLRKVLSASPQLFSALADSPGLLQAEDAAFSSLAQENCAQQRQEQRHKGHNTHSGTNRGPGGALL